MGSRSKNRRPRQARPTTPGQQELAIMERMMQNAIIAKDRIETQAHMLQAEHRQAQIIIAILVQQMGGSVAISDELVENLTIEGIQIERDDENKVVTIAVVEGPSLDDDEEE